MAWGRLGPGRLDALLLSLPNLERVLLLGAGQPDGLLLGPGLEVSLERFLLQPRLSSRRIDGVLLDDGLLLLLLLLSPAPIDGLLLGPGLVEGLWLLGKALSQGWGSCLPPDQEGIDASAGARGSTSAAAAAARVLEAAHA